MRNLEDIEKDLDAAREALSSVEGTPAEVYSRIVGYYRSVRNWNRGKREEYGERRLYLIDAGKVSLDKAGLEKVSTNELCVAGSPPSLLLFTRSSCPGCPPAKAAAQQLGIPLELINTDTAEGLAEAISRNVLSTPTAILLSPEGTELKRARDAQTIGSLIVNAEPIAV